MSLAIVRSRGLVAMAAPEVQVEVHLGNGLPAFSVVGLPQAEVRESRERVRAALLNLGFEFPNRRITVNLAPADLPKESGRFDLPIALGILSATGQIDAASLQGIEAVGELSLTGEVRPIRGAIAMALAVRRSQRARTLVLPAQNADEAALIDDVELMGLRSLADWRCESGRKPGPRATPPRGSAPDVRPPTNDRETGDFADVVGLPLARRMLEIAAAGEHSVLLLGPPGAGKSMLAQRLVTILPPLDDEESAEVAALASLCGRFDPSRWGCRPYRAPHHTASAPALVGGGANPRPGEISLAHHGVLFLDELPEFARPVLEALREPLETGQVTLSRALHHVDFPARFQFIAAMNPCPCGYLGQREGRCRCTPDQVQRYRGRISGPLLDRIDLRLEVEAQRGEQLLDAAGPTRTGESSAAIRARVARGRLQALIRQKVPNGRLQGDALAGLHDACRPAARQMLQLAVNRLSLSARAMTRVLKVARTIADLADVPEIDEQHMAEALQFRRPLSGDPRSDAP